VFPFEDGDLLSQGKDFEDSVAAAAQEDAESSQDQIEGALAYLDTVGTRAEDAVHKRLRLKLTSAHWTLHNALHQRGQYHEHTPVTQHS
jgi:hypothetical protein